MIIINSLEIIRKSKSKKKIKLVQRLYTPDCEFLKIMIMMVIIINSN